MQLVSQANLRSLGQVQATYTNAFSDSFINPFNENFTPQNRPAWYNGGFGWAYATKPRFDPAQDRTHDDRLCVQCDPLSRREGRRRKRRERRSRRVQGVRREAEMRTLL